MKRSIHHAILIVCALTAAAALSLMTSRWSVLQTELRDKTSRLDASRTVWESTAAEKEELQLELKFLQNQIREAELAIAEGQDRSGKLKQEIEDLSSEIESLQKPDD